MSYLPLAYLAYISIHALVKRATKYPLVNQVFPLDFNPRPREEGDMHSIMPLIIVSNFNPRPREEGDGY